MKLIKTIGHSFSMGPYEIFKVGATVEVDTQTDFDNPPTDDEVLEYIDGLVLAAVADEVAEAQMLTTNPDSYVHHLLSDKFNGKADD